MSKSFFKLYILSLSLLLITTLFIPISYAQEEDLSVVGRVKIVESQQDQEQEQGGENLPIPEEAKDNVIVSRERITKEQIIELRARNVEQKLVVEQEEEEEENEFVQPTDPQGRKPVASVRGLNINVIDLPIFNENEEYDIAAIESLEILSEYVDLDILASDFVSKDLTLRLGEVPGEDILQLQFSKDYIEWITISKSGIALNIEKSLPFGTIQDLYFKVKTPTKISEKRVYSSSILIIVSQVENDLDIDR
jgi:hypothetical protein